MSNRPYTADQVRAIIHKDLQPFSGDERVNATDVGEITNSSGGEDSEVDETLIIESGGDSDISSDAPDDNNDRPYTLPSGR